MNRCSVVSPEYNYTLRHVVAIGGRNIKEYPNCGIVFSDLTKGQAEVLRFEGLAVKHERPVGSSQVSVPKIVAPSGGTPFGGAAIDHAATIRALRNLLSPPLTGRGQNVAIFDTGVRTTHKGFGDRIIYNKNFTSAPSYEDVFGHGTSTAWAAAGGEAELGEEQGGAPGAGILNVKVLDDEGMGTEETVVAAMEEMIQMKLDNSPLAPTSINLSLGAPDDGDPDNPLRVACRAATDNLIFVLAAAGNDGPEATTINCPGTDPTIASVGAVQLTTFEVCQFSSRGPTLEGCIKPDFVFFGDDMLVASNKGDNSFTVKAGTSFAVAYANGMELVGMEGFERFKEEGFYIPEFGTIPPTEVGWAPMWLLEHLPDICIKPEGVPPGQDNSYGFGIPMGANIVDVFGEDIKRAIGVGGIAEVITPIVMLGFMSAFVSSVMRRK